VGNCAHNDAVSLDLKNHSLSMGAFTAQVVDKGIFNLGNKIEFKIARNNEDEQGCFARAF